MNLKTSNPFDSNWKRFKAQYVAAACGLALAAAALSGIGSGSNGGTAGTTVPTSRASSSLVVPQRGPSQHTIVVVASEQQAIDQRASLFQDIDPSWYAAYTFIVASNLEQEAFAQYAIAEAMREEGVNLQVLDLRTAPAAVPSRELTNVGNVDPARQGALAPAFSAEYAQYISLQEQVLVALSDAAADAEYAARSLAQVIEQPRISAVDAERAALMTLQEQVLVALADHSITP